MFIWIIIIFVIYAAGFGFLFNLFARKHLVVERQQTNNLSTAKKELESKKEVLERLGSLLPGLATVETLESLKNKVTEIEESIQAEKGRITITEAELEAVDTRLRELEELKRELEVSNMDAVKELDMLRSQEREVAAKNEAMRAQLSDTSEQIDLLLTLLATSAEAVERLTQAKNELVETERQSAFYEERIANINRQYLELKKAYDALDIEYAQLYEKQQASADDAG